MDELWAIVLAGGGGTRLMGEAKRRYGRPRPKQYCDFDGRGTLLQRTVERASLLVPPQRMAVVSTRPWGPTAAESLAHWPGILHLEQPCNKETGPGLLLPAMAIARRAPDAILAVLPSDHHVAQPAAFMAAVLQATEQVRLMPDRVILVGVRPDHVEEGYGWILTEEGPGPIRAVRSFSEKPPRREAERLLRAGALVNTLVMVGAARTFNQLFARHAPAWHHALSRPGPQIIQRAYAELPPCNLSKEVLTHATDTLLALPAEGIGWTDVGTPERLRRALVLPDQAAVAAPHP